MCRNCYFDVDPYGRIYVPNGVTCQVYVADNAGNNIAVFGNYGNTDSRGRLTGPGQLIAQPAIPLAWPTSVGASEDYIYIADRINARLVRVQMVYTIDNIPRLTDRFSASEKAAAWTNLKLSSCPNPFHPVSNIAFFLPAASHVDLTVYGVDGRLVRSLASGRFGPGDHRFSWDARDAAGRNVTPGVYVYKLVAGNRVRMERAILAK
jgi:DNA-binding beta-propeller fold protein YncE